MFMVSQQWYRILWEDQKESSRFSFCIFLLFLIHFCCQFEISKSLKNSIKLLRTRLFFLNIHANKNINAFKCVSFLCSPWKSTRVCQKMSSFTIWALTVSLAGSALPRFRFMHFSLYCTYIKNCVGLQLMELYLWQSVFAIYNLFQRLIALIVNIDVSFSSLSLEDF